MNWWAIKPPPSVRVVTSKAQMFKFKLKCQTHWTSDQISHACICIYQYLSCQKLKLKFSGNFSPHNHSHQSDINQSKSDQARPLMMDEEKEEVRLPPVLESWYRVTSLGIQSCLNASLLSWLFIYFFVIQIKATIPKPVVTNYSRHHIFMYYLIFLFKFSLNLALCVKCVEC